MRPDRIHKDNYEAFLLDRAEGRLPADLWKELDLFLAMNPHLDMDTGGFDELSFVSEPMAFGQKQEIKRSEQDLVSDDMLLAYVERQLDKKEALFVEKSVRNNQGLQAQLVLYKKTILQADLAIVYPSKSSLKRRNKIVWLNPDYARYAAAAVLLLFLGLVFIWKQKPNVSGNTPLVNNKPVGKNTLDAPVLVAQKDNAFKAKSPDQRRLAVQPVKAPGKRDAIKNDSAPVPQQPVLQNNENPMANHVVQEKDSSAINVAVKQPLKQQEVIVSNDLKKTKVLTIIENEDEDMASSKKKSILWAMAGKALRGLNKAGLKTVDGDEQETKQAADYQLTLGGFHVTHSENLQ